MGKTGTCEAARGGGDLGVLFAWDGRRGQKEERRVQIFILLCSAFLHFSKGPILSSKVTC